LNTWSLEGGGKTGPLGLEGEKSPLYKWLVRIHRALWTSRRCLVGDHGIPLYVQGGGTENRPFSRTHTQRSSAKKEGPKKTVIGGVHSKKTLSSQRGLKEMEKSDQSAQQEQQQLSFQGKKLRTLDRVGDSGSRVNLARKHSPKKRGLGTIPEQAMPVCWFVRANPLRGGSGRDRKANRGSHHLPVPRKTNTPCCGS